MPVGKGSIARATSASSTKNSSVVKITMKMPDILTNMPIHQIIPVPQAWMDQSYHSKSTNELIKSIHKYGVIEPVILRRIGDTQFQLLSGYGRLQAIKDIGIEFISSRVIEDLSDEKARAIYRDLHDIRAKETIDLHEAKFEVKATITKDLPVYLL